jgi:hypothetical protein
MTWTWLNFWLYILFDRTKHALRVDSIKQYFPMMGKMNK